MVGVLPKYRIRGRSNVSSESPSSGAEGHSFDTLDLGANYTSELDRSQIDLLYFGNTPPFCYFNNTIEQISY